MAFLRESCTWQIGLCSAHWRLELFSVLSSTAVVLVSQVCYHLPWLFPLAWIWPASSLSPKTQTQVPWGGWMLSVTAPTCVLTCSSEWYSSTALPQSCIQDMHRCFWWSCRLAVQSNRNPGDQMVKAGCGKPAPQELEGK